MTRLAMSGIQKSFGPTHALRGVDLEVRPREIHGLVGENGAGKSTLMKILSGAEKPDAGTMMIDGRAYQPRNPRQAREQGVAMIYQELCLAPDLTVEQNILLGTEPARWGILDRKEGHRRASEALSILDHPEIRLDASLSELSPAAQQLVEIARAFITDVRILVLDEPTSSLTREDSERLFELMRRLRERDVGIVYISHFLEEIESITDRFTVLRDGESVATEETVNFSSGKVIEWMVGRSLNELFPKVPHEIGDPVLRLRDLVLGTGGHADLTLHRGEILGLAGIVGAGRTELLRAIFALDPIRSGEIVIHAIGSTNGTPASRIAQGVGMVSEDRKEEGLALIQSIEDNLTWSRLEPYSLFGWLNLKRRQKATENWLEQLQVRCSGPDQIIGELSGGNQQKVALGRLLHQHADILLLDEPTRGVDIGSKAQIYRLIGEQAAAGKGIIFVSSYLPELLGICDRIAVMSRGRLGPARPTSEWTPEAIMTEAIGRATNQSTSS